MNESPFVTTLRAALEVPPDVDSFLVAPLRDRLKSQLGKYLAADRVLRDAQKQAAVRRAAGASGEFFGSRAIDANRAQMLRTVEDIAKGMKSAGITVSPGVFTAEKKRLKAAGA